MNQMNHFFMNQKELIDQVIDNAKTKLKQHQKMGSQSPYSIFEVASLMDELHFNQKDKRETTPLLISKN